MEYSLVKRTIGKNGKPYYYESLSEVKNVKDVNWYRIDESMYKFQVATFLQTATEVKRDEKGEVEYMVFVFKKELIYKGNKPTVKTYIKSEPKPLTPKQAKNLKWAKTFAFISFGITILVFLLDIFIW